ncbi:MAG TPA: flagellin [Phenylobacterium sp.]
MTRISTSSSYSGVLANLMAAQQRQMEAGDKLATQKNGTDLKGYARNAEMLTAMSSVHTRIQGYLSQNTMVSQKLATQDQALNQVADAATRVRQRIAEALATGSGDGLMLDMESAFRDAVSGLNARFAGKPLFGGGQVSIDPVSAQTLTDLTAPLATIPGFFKNDQFVATSKVDDSTEVTTGFLADGLGTDMLTAFQGMQAFEEGGTGSFGGKLTTAQENFLMGQLQVWEGVASDLTNEAAKNGMVQRRVEDVGQDLVRRQDMMGGMIGDVVDADMAEVVAQLKQAELSVNAAAQVFATLRESSLLNLLRP